MKFSANLGFLWTELPLPRAIHAARAQGFAAVECHWPYDTPADDVAQALAETGLPMLGLNTRRGDVAAGENGLAALPGRGAEARAAVAEAVSYGAAIGARAVHVMAGRAQGPEAEAAFVDTLRHACALAAEQGMTILIEPLNRHDAPGYFLRTTDQAVAIMDRVGADNLRLMFDCYHVGRTEGDVIHRLGALLPRIGHVQIAAVPDRGAPDHGELHYPAIFAELARLGYDAPIGAEYRPGGPTEPTLGWLRPWLPASA
ncbi:hydroxypyruvate isomerase family protein [Roseicyclus persicicus]|uniref:TIM barrel protein n=1 Tax=Roseicyclus persicicus TaxID=2650661 RepID=A0A7X6H0B0_9RHOB|nr:TIM barrel protein [Roseibacterium persicicum]NKX45661.1 TIM barrel protein [Roseibacterium persicicum]